MICHNTRTGKTTYSDGDSLSWDLGDKVRGGNKDALQELKNFAQTFDPEQPHSQARALYELSEVYFNGFCDVEKSQEDALKFLMQAAKLNDDLALIRLGEFYRDGKYNFKQDAQKALELFIAATACENQNGFKLAAEMFRYGKGVEADGYKAIEFYKKLDDLDDKSAQFAIAEIYEKGCGRLKADKQKARAIYNEILRHGKYWHKVYRDFGIKGPQLKNHRKAFLHITELTD